jgi:hypothetical protein
VGVLEEVRAGLVGEAVAVLRRTSQMAHGRMVRRSHGKPPAHGRGNGE